MLQNKLDNPLSSRRQVLSLTASQDRRSVLKRLSGMPKWTQSTVKAFAEEDADTAEAR